MTTLSRRHWLGLNLAALGSASFGAAQAQPPQPRPHGPLPSARHLAWHAIERYAFVHFSLNTFTDREWGYGDESPALFQPSDFSADQIVQTVKEAGLRGLILTAKHHDGFCLWPSRYTEHSVRHSPWREGRGDLVREVSEACRRQGLAFGIYLSPWDRHHAEYGRPAYIEYFRNQLRELLTQYGPIFQVWFDGANGGDGYYGGAREARKIDPPSYYDWPRTWALVRELQPDTVIWGQRGSDVRWVGNEEGYAGDPCWATMDEQGPFSPSKNEHGVRDGTVWRPAEVDVSIRPGWFWHAHEDEQVKTLSHLLRIYFESVGRGANLLLSFAPDRRGRIPDADRRVARDWGVALAATFGKPLTQGARALASASHADPAHGPDKLLDGRSDSFWTCDETELRPELTLQLARPTRFDVVRLREHLPLGQRVHAFALDAWIDGRWQQFAHHESIGPQRLVRLASPLTTTRVRLRILAAAASPALSEFELFRLAEVFEAPQIGRDREGRVTLSAVAGDAIHFSVDGTTPTRRSPRYRKAFALAEGGVVKAVCFRPGQSRPSPVTTRSYDIAKVGWRIVQASAPGAEALFDEAPATLWESPLAAELTLSLGRTHELRGFSLMPAAQLPAGAGAPVRYVCQLSLDGETWSLAGQGEFSNIAANSGLQTLRFAKPWRAGFVRLQFPQATAEQGRIAFAELGVLTR
ncbi:alpha-L-fucosidase [Paucibacter oligotrophus]|uniref:alpha-L-fucosidase n=1 Tax=Roseateles oligotrophus TaxID=1769250 RepID=A0A840LAG2_9BURK|nr:alpha-L-fucosidase [Roseateles oligotrophus]MBB4843652.1 alpha-L-fucosidase [Roseateles oligotrophus]